MEVCQQKLLTLEFNFHSLATTYYVLPYYSQLSCLVSVRHLAWSADRAGKLIPNALNIHDSYKQLSLAGQTGLRARLQATVVLPYKIDRPPWTFRYNGTETCQA